jgi:ABC-type lipoprotein export system ATPase subunit/ABC-type antimicrobial peptide transport system permease subunit
MNAVPSNIVRSSSRSKHAVEATQLDKTDSDAECPNVAIRIRDLRKDYHLATETVHVLKGIHLDVPRGDYVAIMGPSGSGKSTLLNLIGGLDTPTSGEYFIGDQNVANLSDDQLSKIRAQRIGFVFQAYNLLPQLNVIENIEVPLAYNGGMSANDRERTLQLVRLVGLDQRSDHRPTELSGGQQQRAGIARSLVNHPEFILADEATGNLDSSTTEEILALFDDLNSKGATIVMVTHEEDVALRARRIVRLRDGVIESDNRMRPPSEATHESHMTSRRGRPSQLRLRARDLRLGLKTLLMHPLRSMLTVLGIFIGVASVIWLLAISEGIASKANEQIQELGADNIIVTTARPSSDASGGQKIYYYGLTDEDYRHLKSTLSSVNLAIPFYRRTGREFRYLSRKIDGEVNACTADYKDLYSLKVSRGRFLIDQDNETKAKVCVLATEVAQQLFRHEDPIGKSIRIEFDLFRVVGVVATREEMESVKSTSNRQDFSDNVYIPLETYWARFGESTSTGNNGGRAISQITLRLKDQRDAVATGEAVQHALKRTHLYEDFSVGVPLALLQQAQNTRLMFMAMMGLLAGISLLVGGIGIMNIMLATVTERTREIGIRRALGAQRLDITRQFLIETVLLSMAGGITGVLGGLTCGKLVDFCRWILNQSVPDLMASLPETVQSMQPIVIPWSLPIAFGISVTVGVVFGIYPALRAAAMNPIEALRHVG